MKNLLRAGAVALALLACAPAAAQSLAGLPAKAPAGFLPGTIIYCDNGSGLAAICSIGGGGGGGGAASATATAAPPAYTEGNTAAPLSLNLAGDLRTIAKQGGAWSVGLTGTLPAFAVVPTFNVGTIPSLTIAALPAAPANEAHIGAVGGTAPVVGATMTRPADVIPYASGDLVANSTTATAVVPLAVTLARVNGGTGQIYGVRLSKSGTSITNASFRVHFFKGLAAADANGHFVTVTGGDNAPFVANIVAARHIGYVDIAMDIVGSDGAKGSAAPARNLLGFDANTSVKDLYVLIEARGAYTPVSGEVFTVAVEHSED